MLAMKSHENSRIPIHFHAFIEGLAVAGGQFSAILGPGALVERQLAPVGLAAEHGRLHVLVQVPEVQMPRMHLKKARVDLEKC